MILNDELHRLIHDHSWQTSLLLRKDCLFEMEAWTPPATAYTDSQSAGLSSDAQSSWWYQTRNRVIYKGIQKFGNGEVLWDIGSGAGEVSLYLNEKGVRTICVEPSHVGAEISASRGITSIAGDLSKLNLPNDCLGQIGMFDVIEHIANRSDFLREAHRVMRPGGLLFLTVPALSILWGQMDVQAGHFVRYSRRTVRRELRNAGFKCIVVGYFFMTLVLPLLIVRAIPYRIGLKQPVSDGAMLKSNGKWIGNFLERFEVSLSRYSPLGTSLFVVASKSD